MYTFIFTIYIYLSKLVKQIWNLGKFNSKLKSVKHDYNLTAFFQKLVRVKYKFILY